MKPLVRAPWLGLLIVMAGSASGLTQEAPETVDLRAARPAIGNTFEALFFAYRKAEAAGDTENQARILDEIRRLRTERNIRTLEPLGLVFVGRGLETLQRGDAVRAQSEFQRAIAVDPWLPDAQFGLVLSHLKQGPLAIVAAVRDVVNGLTVRLPSSYGRHRGFSLLICTGMLTVFLFAAVFSFVMVIRHGGLLLHDLEEVSLGRNRSLATAGFALLLLVPVVAFQGYGWLPLWWMALLFIYLTAKERLIACLVLLVGLVVGPTLEVLQARSLAWADPLFRAGVLAIEGASDVRALQAVEAALRRSPKDRDLAYLLGILHKKLGNYDQAASVYRDILKSDDKDPVALNNLANLDFARQEFAAAAARYKAAKQAAEATGSAETTATICYNLSLAHLQKFERVEAEEARSQADRLAGRLTRGYDSDWKYETRNENAVVDVGPTEEQIHAKLAANGSPSLTAGSLAKSLLNRFLGFAALFVLLVFAVTRWRGPRMFTLRCSKCGTPFCKRCHLGAAPAGLCTQCYHLFVVRDGVSGPARSRKLIEVQAEDQRRERVFRILSLISPGAGHLYAHKTLAGAVFVLLWYFVLSFAFLGGRLLPFTEVSSRFTGYYPLIAAALILFAIYVVANRARPDFEEALPLPRGPRRGRG